jgi:hypothetical protein
MNCESSCIVGRKWKEHRLISQAVDNLEHRKLSGAALQVRYYRDVRATCRLTKLCSQNQIEKYTEHTAVGPPFNQQYCLGAPSFERFVLEGWVGTDLKRVPGLEFHLLSCGISEADHKTNSLVANQSINLQS